MKKHAFITLCLMFLLLFVAVSCNPEVKADPLDEQKQSIPAENVDMTNAPVVTEAQESSFAADYYAAKDRVFSGLIAKSLTTENFSIVDALNYYFTGRTPKAVDEETSEGSDEATVSVLVESMSGELSMKANKMVFEYTSTPEGDSKPVVEEITIENISATATLSGKSISLVVSGMIGGDSFSATIGYSINAKNVLERGNSTFTDVANEELYKKIKNADVSEISGMTVEAKALVMNANIAVKDFSMSIPATAAVEGKASVEISEKSGMIKINSLTLSVDIPQLADVDMSIRNLVINAAENETPDEDGLEFKELSIDRISINGTILPLMDNIRFEASINGASISDSLVIAIDSVDASAMGYESIAAAAEIKGILVDISSEEGALAFSFGAAVSFGNQTIGIRGDLSSNPLEITMLNGNPVAAESLLELIMRLVFPSDEGTV